MLVTIKSLFTPLIDQELIRMTIYIEDGVSVKEKELKSKQPKN